MNDWYNTRDSYFTLHCQHCGQGFIRQASLERHEGLCLQAIRFEKKGLVEAPKVNLHLTLEDAFARGSEPGIQHSRAMKRHLRKQSERFHRMVLRSKAKKRAKLAIKFGNWKPKNDLRNKGDNQS